MPLPIKAFLIPLTAETLRYRSISGRWLLSRFRHTDGWMHEGRLHLAQSAWFLPFMRYMLADGPPRSER